MKYISFVLVFYWEICIDCFDMNEWMQCWMSGCNVEYIDEDWQDSQNTCVNTAIANLVILTSGSIFMLLTFTQDAMHQMALFGSAIWWRNVICKNYFILLQESLDGLAAFYRFSSQNFNLELNDLPILPYICIAVLLHIFFYFDTLNMVYYNVNVMPNY